jgi:cell division protein FtsB
VTTTTGHRTSSIPRPVSPNGSSGAPRGRGRRQPPGDDTRLVQRKRTRNLLAVGATLVVLALAAALLVLPFRAWLNQRAELEERKTELVALQQANAVIAAENARLQTPQGIQEAARDDLGFLGEGETGMAVLPSPPAGEILPPHWPFTMVGDIWGTRVAAEAAAAAAAAAAATTTVAAQPSQPAASP